MNEPEVFIRLDDNGRAYLPGDCALRRVSHRRHGRARTCKRWKYPFSGTPRARATRTWPYTSSGGRMPAAGEVWANGRRRPDRFSTTLPQSPLSYDGQIVKIRWCVRVRVIFKRGRDLVADKVFRLGNVPPAKPAAVEPAVAKKNDGIEEFS